MPGRTTFAIIGAGQAGAAAAESLRGWGFDGRVVLIGEEPVRPYERPPLSKDYLRDQATFEDAAVHASDFYESHSVELLLSTRVTEVDLRERRVALDSGTEIRYERLLIAAGASPRTLAVPGAELESVFTLRTLADADRIRQAKRTASRAVVIGAGWVGTEVAASLRQGGLEVAVVDPNRTPMERSLGQTVGRVWCELHGDHGVELHLGVTVEAIEGNHAAEAVRLSDGSVLACDLVVVGVGVTPRTELALAAGLEVNDGIVVDQHLETSVPGVFAAGDVASAYHPLLRSRIRVEHWLSALTQGPTAAANMLGYHSGHDRIPWFASQQYDLYLEYTGHAQATDQLVTRGSLADRRFVAFWLRDGRVRAGMSVNVLGTARHIRALVASGSRVDIRALADPSVGWGELVRQGLHPGGAQEPAAITIPDNQEASHGLSPN
ncbi:MAG: NAD(P)/FAD-dependent oxidoreductase [Candidatus Dormibacteria bacterium]